MSVGDVLCKLASNDGLAEGQLLETKLLLDVKERRKALESRKAAIHSKFEQDKDILERSYWAALEIVTHLEGEHEALVTRLAIASRRRDQGLKLFQSGSLSENDLTELEDHLQTRTAELNRSRKQLEDQRLRVSTHDSHVRRLNYERAEALAVVEVQFQIIDMEEARISASEEQRILAPQAGQVASIWAKAGASVSPGEPLLDIMPTEQALQAKLYADPSTMGTVGVGHAVRVYIDALPYESHRAQVGVVSAISKTTIASENAGHVPAYRISVVFPDGLDLPPRHIQSLRPGMTVSADLILGHATIFDWLLNPLRRGLERV